MLRLASLAIFDDYGVPSGATLQIPRGALFVLGARRDDGIGYDGVYAARFDCE